MRNSLGTCLVTSFLLLRGFWLLWDVRRYLLLPYVQQLAIDREYVVDNGNYVMNIFGWLALDIDVPLLLAFYDAILSTSTIFVNDVHQHHHLPLALGIVNDLRFVVDDNSLLSTSLSSTQLNPITAVTIDLTSRQPRSDRVSKVCHRFGHIDRPTSLTT